jgi:hypothetical protein
VLQPGGQLRQGQFLALPLNRLAANDPVVYLGALHLLAEQRQVRLGEQFSIDAHVAQGDFQPFRLEPTGQQARFKLVFGHFHVGKDVVQVIIHSGFGGFVVGILGGGHAQPGGALKEQLAELAPVGEPLSGWWWGLTAVPATLHKTGQSAPNSSVLKASIVGSWLNMASPLVGWLIS